MVNWLEICALKAEGPGSIPGQGTKITQAMQYREGRGKKERKENREVLKF